MTRHEKPDPLSPERVRGRCLWCGQDREDLLALPQRHRFDRIVMACADHVGPMEAYVATAARNSRWTLLVSVVSALLVIGGGMAATGAVIACGLLVLGLGLLRFPFGTPDAVRRLGARRAMRLARWIGLAVLVAGVAGLAAAAWGLPLGPTS